MQQASACNAGQPLSESARGKSQPHLIQLLKLFPDAMQGLAYSVSGGWSTTPADHVGLFTAGGETAKPAEFLAALQKVLQVADHAPGTEAFPE